MPSPDQKPKITIRAASREDLPILRELLSARDDEQRHDAAVRDHLMDCDPERFLAWIAFDGDEPVGLTALYLRPLRFDGDEPVDEFTVVVDSSQRCAAASESSEVRVDASE